MASSLVNLNTQNNVTQSMSIRPSTFLDKVVSAIKSLFCSTQPQLKRVSDHSGNGVDVPILHRKLQVPNMLAEKSLNKYKKLNAVNVLTRGFFKDTCVAHKPVRLLT